MSKRNKEWEKDVKGIVEVIKVDSSKKSKLSKKVETNVEEASLNTPNKMDTKEVVVSSKKELPKDKDTTTNNVKQDVEQKNDKPIEDSSPKEKEKSLKNEIENKTEQETKQNENSTNSLDDILKKEGIKLYDEMDEIKQTKLEILSKEIKDRHSIIFFGSRAQESLNRVSESILEKVKSKDLGYAGENLNKLVTILKGFDIEELDPTKKQGFFSKLFGGISPVEKFLSKYDDIRVQIDTIVDDLEEKKSRLLVDITALEKLYGANFEFIKNLDEYIAAGAYKVKELEKKLKELEKEAQGNTRLEKKLGVRDLRALITALEARVHDMKLSRMVALQSLPSIRLIQDNNKTLVEKINSTLTNTLPLWKNQLAQAVAIFRSKKASESIKAAQDFTNELLEKNAEKLKEATKEITEQANRGVFDIESIKKANQTLISSINESLQITEKAKEARAKAEVELSKIEQELQEALIAAEKRKIKV